MNNKYVSRKKASEILGIHYHTVYALAKRKEIETVKIGKRQLYNVNKYLQKQKIPMENEIRRKICYCRVSSSKQKEDLQRQIEYMKKKYPNYEIISDIGSGLNMNREGLKKIIDSGIKGEIEILVVAYKDRLVRFGYELIERIIKEYSNGEVKIENNEEEKTPMKELTTDIVSIMNVYVAKMNGLRKYKKMLVDDIKKVKE
jgi:predicted site-specific integrase-resolvase